EGVERVSSISSGEPHDVIDRIARQLDPLLPVSSLLIAKRVLDDLLEVMRAERLEHENARTADERLVDLEVGVLGRRSDKDERAVLHVRQEGILLRLVEAMDLVDEKDRPS